MLVVGLEGVRVWLDPVANVSCPRWAEVGCGLGIPDSSNGPGLSGSESGFWLGSSEHDADLCSDSREYPGRSTEVEAEDDLCLALVAFRFDENSDVLIRKVSGFLRPCLGVGSSPPLPANGGNAVSPVSVDLLLGLSVISIRAGVAGPACPGGVSEPSRDKGEICGAANGSGGPPWSFSFASRDWSRKMPAGLSSEILVKRAPRVDAEIELQTRELLQILQKKFSNRRPVPFWSRELFALKTFQS